MITYTCRYAEGFRISIKKSEKRFIGYKIKKINRLTFVCLHDHHWAHWIVSRVELSKVYFMLCCCLETLKCCLGACSHVNTSKGLTVFFSTCYLKITLQCFTLFLCLLIQQISHRDA